MKFRVARDVLADAVTWAARTVPPRPPAPVLSGILIEATADGLLTLSSFDYEVSARIQVAAEVSEAGTLLVSGRLLSDIARSLPNKPVEISVEGSRASLVCGSSRFTLLTMPVDEYPALPPMPEQVGTVDGEAFGHAVTQVSVAAAKDNTLPLLSAVRVEFVGETITMLATDRYRLAMRELAWAPQQLDVEMNALVPAKTLLDAAKSLGTGSISLGFQTGTGIERVGFEAAGRLMTSQLIDGEYPHVRRLFETTTNHAVVDTQELVAATKRVSLVAERNTSIRLGFSQGQVVLDAGQGDEAQASEILPATLEGEDITVAFNPTYLLDGLNALGTSHVQLGFTHRNKPVEFIGQDGAEGEPNLGYRYLLVPMRLTA